MTIQLNVSALAKGVVQVAALLGEETGECADCGRPVRLTSGGLVPDHQAIGRKGARYCTGGGTPIGGGLR